MKTILFLFFAAFASGAWGDIYRCPGPDGQPRFQDQPCPGHAASEDRIEVRPQPITGSSSAAEIKTSAPDDEVDAQRPRRRSKEPCDRPDENTLRKARIEHRVLLCMTPDEVLLAAEVTMRDHTVEQNIDGGESWFFPQHSENFPAIIRFTGGYVSGFGDIDPYFPIRRPK